MAANLPKSTSDDSHHAGDSKQSENKHFAGVVAEVTGDTSDGTHLADDSKRRENAAGSSGYAPPVQEGGRMTGDTSVDNHHAGHAFTDTTLALVEEERRIASDGNAYTFREFLEHYGEKLGTSKWSAAQDTPPPAPPPQENVQAAAVNTLLTPEEPHLCVNDLVPLTECLPFRKKKNKNSRSQRRERRERWLEYQREKGIPAASETKLPKTPLCLTGPPPHKRPHPRRTRKTCEYDMARFQESLGEAAFAYKCGGNPIPCEFELRLDEQTATITSCCKLKMQ